MTQREEGPVRVVSVRGEVDLSAAGEFQAALLDGPSEEGQIVVGDLSEVSFLDSTGLGALVSAEDRIRSAGGELRLVVSAPNVLKVFEITGLTVTFSIFSTLADAVGS